MLIAAPGRESKPAAGSSERAGTDPLQIRMNMVYVNQSGEQRLAISVGRRAHNPVVEWRTPDPKLPLGAKAHGSATVASFRRWAVSARKAAKEDWEAFDLVQRLRRLNREEKQWIREWKQRKAKTT
ncbi:MAG: hypothetical protein V9E94_01210 [Microthrixaceae bacterium]